MKLSILRNLLRAFLFLLRHVVLVIAVNVFVKLFFHGFIFRLLDDTMARGIDNVFGGYIFSGRNIVLAFTTSLALIVKLGFYVIAINNDRENVENEVMIYFSDFIANMYYIFTSTYTFLFLLMFLSIFVLPGIIFLNCCTYFIIYSVFKRQENAKRYGPIEAILKSFSASNGNRLKLILCNTILFALSVVILINSNFSIIISGISIIPVVKMCIVDFNIAYLLNIGFDIDKIQSMKMEEVKQNEVENQYKAMRARSTV
jgi:hypothetical protein